MLHNGQIEAYDRIFSGELLGLAAPPPFADPNTRASRILGGVNYASAAAGILDESGQHYVTCSICLCVRVRACMLLSLHLSL